MRICLAILLLTVALGKGEVIVLNNGSEIRGDIVIEKPDYIVVDLGFSALTIVRDHIRNIVRPQISCSADVNAVALLKYPPYYKDRTKLYYTGPGEFDTIEKCVQSCSEAVVKVSHPGGLGSGFFINEQGYLVTNFHVIENETKITVTMFKKTATGFDKIKFKKVKIVATNPFVDLALLKVEDLKGCKIVYVTLADNDSWQVGQKVFAIGNPLGLERSVHDGIISTSNRAFEGLVYIQTNTDINPGNSGGPLFNLKGQVIGVTNMGYIFMGGLGFAIPVDYVKHFLNNYEAFSYDIDSPNTGYRYLQPDGMECKLEK